MNDSLFRRLARRAGMLGLAVLLVAVSGGFAYVAHLTEVTSHQIGDAQPSVLPLIALSILFAIAGLATLRFTLSGDAEPA